jgi:DNA-binding NarL/FixJ family response regulator
MKRTAFLIVDDHPVYRDALGDKFGAEFADWKLPVRLAACAQEGIGIVRAGPQYDWVVLLDIVLPGLSGQDAISLFRQQPQVRHVVSISGLDEREWKTRVIRFGASAFISKNNVSQFICDQVRKLLHVPVASSSLPPAASSDIRLTSRQREVLSLMANGYPNKIIADQLTISEQTVKIHINQIFRELRVFNRTQAVLKAQKCLLV